MLMEEAEEITAEEAAAAKEAAKNINFEPTRSFSTKFKDAVISAGGIAGGYATVYYVAPQAVTAAVMYTAPVTLGFAGILVAAAYQTGVMRPVVSSGVTLIAKPFAWAGDLVTRKTLTFLWDRGVAATGFGAEVPANNPGRIMPNSLIPRSKL
jgi:hypothetical protein